MRQSRYWRPHATTWSAHRQIYSRAFPWPVIQSTYINKTILSFYCLAMRNVDNLSVLPPSDRKLLSKFWYVTMSINFPSVLMCWFRFLSVWGHFFHTAIFMTNHRLEWKQSYKSTQIYLFNIFQHIILIQYWHFGFCTDVCWPVWYLLPDFHLQKWCFMLIFNLFFSIRLTNIQ